MPTFDFSFIKKEKKKKTSNNFRKSEIVERNVHGIIWVDKNANYYVLVDNNIKYNIHPNSYSCKGKKQIYIQGLDYKGRTMIVRNTDNILNDCNKHYYLPFAPGCSVSGSIVIQYGIKYFIIKRIWVDLVDNHAHEALTFYKNNYKEINNSIKKKRDEF